MQIFKCEKCKCNLQTKRTFPPSRRCPICGRVYTSPCWKKSWRQEIAEGIITVSDLYVRQ